MAVETLHITNDALTIGKTLTLEMLTSGDDEGIVIFNLEGLGPPPATVNAVGGPNFPGTHVNSSHVGPRSINLTLAVINGVNGVNNETLAKTEIYNHFPTGGPVEFRIETAGNDVITDAIVESVESNQFAKIENVVIGLYCAYPWWRTNANWTRAFTTSGLLHVYSSVIPSGGLITITYTGTHGSDITLTNSNGSQSMTIDYSDLIAFGVTPPSVDDLIEIDTRDGQKSIRFWDDSAGEWHNIMSALTVNDDWINMRYGNNTLTYSCSIGSDESDMTAFIFHRELYQGV